MAEVSQNIKYVRLDDGVSFSLVRTNPKLTTNTKLMYNGKRIYMESYASSPLMNRSVYKNVSVRPNSTYNRDIASFLTGSGPQAYNVYQNFGDNVISDSYDNQFETLYWCGAEYISSSFYTEEIGFVAPLYLREKLPNYFLIFRLDTPSNYNFTDDSDGNINDPIFDFKADILDKAVLIKTFDLREGTPLGKYIHKYIEQDGFEFDKSMYVNFSNSEVTYYGINKVDGLLEKKVESFQNELVGNDNPILKDDKWFTEGFERNNLIFPYIMNIEYLFDDDNFKHDEKEIYDFARYIGVYCNNIEFGEFTDLSELSKDTEDNVIYYFEDNKKNLHRYSNNSNGFIIDGKSVDDFDNTLISGFEKERITGYAEPLDIYEGFINRAQYGFEILQPLDSNDWIEVEYNGNKERYSVDENGSLNDIAKSLSKCINRNKDSKFEAKYSDNVVVIYAKREGKEYNGSTMLISPSMIEKISLPRFNFNETEEGYKDYFYGACETNIDPKTDTYKNVFKIYIGESIFFDVDRYLKTNNGNGRKIYDNIPYINAEGKIDLEYNLIIVESAPEDKYGDLGYDISVSSTYQVEILDKFKPNHGVFSWFPVKDFDFDINYTSYGQYAAFVDECDILSEKIVTNSQLLTNIDGGNSEIENDDENIDISRIKELAKSPFFDDFGNSLSTEYDYYFEQIHPDLCLLSKTAPYISKWGYYDDQKDSCENPYRLNVNKIFGVSNLSANTFLIECNENEYTHSMPYYMTLNTPDYYKDYQYIECDEKYSKHYDKNVDVDGEFETFSDCVNYWIDVFMRTDVDMFSYYFSGKKYGKRFDKKYSRLLGGNKFHNPSTLFRGVKFEAVRQYNGFDKRTSEYNDYKFSFVYIPVMNDSMIFNSTVHFIKNDTFRFIVGIVFVNTMLGKYNHNIFSGNVDYFNKGFLYATCKDIIRPENSNKYTYNLTLSYADSDKKDDNVENVYNAIWENNYDASKENNEFYMWIEKDGKYGKSVIVTTTRDAKTFSNYQKIIGEFYIDGGDAITDIVMPTMEYSLLYAPESSDEFKVSWESYYEKYDTTVYGFKTYEYYGSVSCKINVPNIVFENVIFADVCDIDWSYYNDMYIVDISNIHFKSESLRNILINMGSEDSVTKISFYNNSDDVDSRVTFENAAIKVDSECGNITIKSTDSDENSDTLLVVNSIDNIRMDIFIKDRFDTNFESLGLKDYFSIFNQLSMHSIAEYVNSDYNVKYYSTVEDNKYKMRVIEPDSIEIKDMFEALPIKVTHNNKSVIGSVEIKKKMNVDNIGIKVINRYSGFYNPIFNDIFYYGDYTEMPYSNTHIDYNYSDGYGEFGVIKNMYFHKTNPHRSDSILTSENPVYPAINEYALDYRDYNVFSSSWDEGYFISQDDLNSTSVCDGIGSMKDSLCMFGSKYLNIPDYIFIDTFENGKIWDDRIGIDIGDNTDTEIMYKEINDKTVRYHLFIEKRLKRHLKESLISIFENYINKNYSFGNKGTIEDDVDEYVEKNLLKLYKVDKIYMYVKDERMRINDKKIENEYLEYMDKNNELKIDNGFPVIDVEEGVILKDSKFIMGKLNEFDRIITYNLKPGFKESFGFGVSFKRK